ncbi:hypothetical protein IscW_ISCW016348, partial [Ixodes scapularis]
LTHRMCQVARRSITFLGHVIRSGTHDLDPNKVVATKGVNHPLRNRELRSVLGLCDFYRSTALCKAATLAILNLQEPYWHFTDASEAAAEAYLPQIGGDGVGTPIAFG